MTALNGLLLVGWSIAVFEVMRMAELRFGRFRKSIRGHLNRPQTPPVHRKQERQAKAGPL